MLIGITGRARAGKTTAARHLVETYGFTELSFAKALKDMALAVNPIVGMDYDWHNADEPEAITITPRRLADVVKVDGWEGGKDMYPEVRRFLQRLGTEGVRGHLGDRAWVNVVDDQLDRLWTTDHNALCDGGCTTVCAGDNNRRPIVIADVRFENEAAMIRANGGRVIRIERTNQATEEYEHASEKPVDADEVLTNFDGDSELMKAELDALVEAMK